MIREGLQEEVTWEQRDYLGRAHRERDQQEGRSLADAFTEWGGGGGVHGTRRDTPGTRGCRA